MPTTLPTESDDWSRVKPTRQSQRPGQEYRPVAALGLSLTVKSPTLPVADGMREIEINARPIGVRR